MGRSTSGMWQLWQLSPACEPAASSSPVLNAQASSTAGKFAAAWWQRVQRADSSSSGALRTGCGAPLPP